MPSLPRLAALLTVAITCASTTGCVVFAVPNFGPSDMPPPEPEDHTAAIVTGVAVGAIAITFAAILIARSRNSEAFNTPVPEEDPVVISPTLRAKFTRGLVAAQAGDCNTALRIDDELALAAPTFRSHYASELAIAACRTP